MTTNHPNIPNETLFNSSRAPGAVGLYLHALLVGGLLFLSGAGTRQKGIISSNQSSELLANPRVPKEYSKIRSPLSKSPMNS
jgi:hypothetical protein